ncbi:MAG: hemolysin family protein [Gemmatimonadota bacterium]
MIWLVFIAGVLLTGFGATAGAALMTVSRRELTQVVSRRLRGAGPSLGWLAHADDYLTSASATTSLGVLLVGASLPAMAGTSPLLRVTVAFALALATVVFAVVTGYLIPRWLTRPRAEAVATRILPVIRPWSSLLALVLPARRRVRAHDLRAIWREGAAGGLGSDEEFQMIGGVMTFTQRQVREVMTPRTDIAAVEETASLAEIAAVFARSGFSRIPIYRGTVDEIVGMLHAFDLFKLRPGDPLPVRPVALTPATRSCGDLLLDMQRERRHLAVVIDEFGGTLGVATLEDLLQELVGEVFEENDGRVAAVPEAATLLEADANTSLEDIEEQFAVELPRRGATTLAGLIAELAGRIPAAGERFTLAGLEVDVIDATPMRAERFLVRRPAGAPERLEVPG